MVVATPEQMALFDEQHLNGDRQMGGAEDLDRMVYYPGGSATLRELNEMKEGGGWWYVAVVGWCTAVYSKKAIYKEEEAYETNSVYEEEDATSSGVTAISAALVTCILQ